MKRIISLALLSLLLLFIGNVFAQPTVKLQQKEKNNFSTPNQKQKGNNSLSVRTNKGRVYGQVARSPLTVDPQYLIFQLFTYGPLYGQPITPFDSTYISSQVDSILAAVDNNRGDGTTRQLGFAVGALTFDNSDADLRNTIRQSFKIAEEKDVAVVFHIDDSMFWINRNDLWSDPKNVEWSDWNGTIVPHRDVSWAAGITLAPQMCYNSPAIKQAVQHIAQDVIGAEIKKGIDTLIAHHKEQLFAGVIAGWETNLEDYRYIASTDVWANHLRLPRVKMGYNALSNLGYSAANLPANFDSALERVVHDWADFWAMNLQSAGIDSSRIYTHFALPTPPGGLQHYMANLSTHLSFQPDSFSFCSHVMPYTAFNNHSRPGFSTYTSGFLVNGVDAVLARIIAERQKHGNPRWADAESGFMNTAAISWEKYIFDMFHNGASIVNIFAWQFPANSGNPFGIATHSKGAIGAFKKFLTGESN